VDTTASSVEKLVNLFSIGTVNKIKGLKNVAITKKKKKSLPKNSAEPGKGIDIKIHIAIYSPQFTTPNFSDAFLIFILSYKKYIPASHITKYNINRIAIVSFVSRKARFIIATGIVPKINPSVRLNIKRIIYSKVFRHNPQIKIVNNLFIIINLEDYHDQLFDCLIKVGKRL